MSDNFHKSKEKQNLKSSSLLALFCLVGFALSIIATPWNRDSAHSQSEKALQRAEIVGYQLVQLYREASKNTHDFSKKTRGPASTGLEIADLRTIGTMGLDDWGQPYRYRILSTDQNKLRVLVWSSGPDGSVQTAELENEDAKLSAQPSFAGDDLGVMMSMSVN
jgi:hypothetical protein